MLAQAQTPRERQVEAALREDEQRRELAEANRREAQKCKVAGHKWHRVHIGSETLECSRCGALNE